MSIIKTTTPWIGNNNYVYVHTIHDVFRNKIQLNKYKTLKLYKKVCAEKTIDTKHWEKIKL